MKKIRLGKIPLTTRILAGLFLALALSVVIMGLDNVPGIITGMVAGTVLVLELTRRWRSIRRFIFLAAGSVIAAVIISGLYMELAQPLALRIGGTGALESTPWFVFSGIISYSILLIAPGCIAIGFFGASILSAVRFSQWLQKRSLQQEGPASEMKNA